MKTHAYYLEAVLKLFMKITIYHLHLTPAPLQRRGESPAQGIFAPLTSYKSLSFGEGFRVRCKGGYKLFYIPFQKSLLVIAQIIFCLATATGQDVHFSQFYASPLQINPAQTGFFNG